VGLPKEFGWREGEEVEFDDPNGDQMFLCSVGEAEWEEEKVNGFLSFFEKENWEEINGFGFECAGYHGGSRSQRPPRSGQQTKTRIHGASKCYNRQKRQKQAQRIVLQFAFHFQSGSYRFSSAQETAGQLELCGYGDAHTTHSSAACRFHVV